MVMAMMIIKGTITRNSVIKNVNVADRPGFLLRFRSRLYIGVAKKAEINATTITEKKGLNSKKPIISDIRTPHFKAL